VSLIPGTRLGPYELQAAIGSGGMGQVYRARDTRLERTVAIKVLLPALAASPLFRERFEREARAISQLSHRHICTLFDVGTAETANGASSIAVSYLVMELLEGETLADRLVRGPLPADQALTYAVQIADALDAAHRAGIVHGDLKPGNVMVTRAGIKLLDFGLAARLPGPAADDSWKTDATRTVAIEGAGALLGTLQYLAPEQLEGKTADARSDIFACGAVTFEMVTGRKCFDGHSQASVIAAIMRDEPPSMALLQPAVPPGLDFVVATCLARDPDDRWQTAGDLMRALTGSAAAAAAARRRPDRSPARGSAKVWKALAATLGIAILATLAALIYSMRRPAPPPAAVYRTSIVLPEGLRFPVALTIGGIGRFSISPDGRQMAFVATDPGGGQMLWVRPLDGLAATAVPGTDGASSPFWSPDSRSLGFFAGGQLKTITLGGGAPVVVAAPAVNATGSWNRDNVILYTPSASSPLFRVAASGGTSTPVTTLDKKSGDLLHRNPFFLPDGRHFLYVAVAARDGGTTGPRAVYVASLDANEPARLLSDSGSNAKYADGHLLFGRENMLLAQPFDVDSLALTGEPKPVAEQVELVGSSSAAFTVSDTGVLVYQPADRGSQLVWFDREGLQLGTVGDVAEYGDVEMSPDGRRAVVSVLDPAVNSRDLWIVDLERGVRSRFTFDKADDVVPVWSGDGLRVLFASNRRGHFDLYEKAAGGVGSESLVLADETEKYPTSWAPDGKTIMYWSFDAEGARLSVLTRGEEQRPAPYLDGPANAGRFSPDGRWVTYYSSESGRPEVYVVPFPTLSSKWQVSSSGGSLSRWRADGQEIFYAGRDNKLMAVPVTGRGQDLAVGAARPLFDARPVGPRSFYAASADGQRFLVNTLPSESASSSMIVVQNWRASLQP
jgi:Tol biopolymer transport system component